MMNRATWCMFVLLTTVSLTPLPAFAADSGGLIDIYGNMLRDQQLREDIKRQQLENQLLEQQLLEQQRQQERLRQEEIERQRQASDRARRKVDEEEKRNAFSTGSGFFVAPDGYLVTNAHVIKEHENIAVRDQSGRLLSAALIAVDTEHDLALLRVAGKFKPLRIDQSSRVSKGQRVMAIGYPQPTIQGSESKVTDGVISSFTGINNDANWFQISVPIQGGNSGGPLINEDGVVIGVVVASVNVQKYFSVTGNIPQNVNYAIKAKVLLDFLANQHIRNSGYSRTKSSIASVDRATVLVIAQHEAFVGSIAAPQIAKNEEEETEQKDAALTLKDLEQLAAKGNVEAQYKLGNLYEYGNGVPKDIVKAFEWWLRAAAQGYGKSQYSVGFAYREGEGVGRDLVRGYVWFSLAAAQGVEDAKVKRDRLKLSLTVDQITEGERLISSWKTGDTLLTKD